MATSKKKPSAAQLAARKLFAQRAKAGTLKKTAKRKPAAKRAKNPTKKSAPVKRSATRAVSRKPAQYAVYAATVSRPWLGTFASLADAKAFAQDCADRTHNSYSIEKV